MTSSCEKGDQPEHTLKISDKMRCQSIVPDVVTYNALPSAYEKGQQAECALEIVKKSSSKA